MEPNSSVQVQLEGPRDLSAPSGSSGFTLMVMGSLDVFSHRSNVVRFCMFCFKELCDQCISVYGHVRHCQSENETVVCGLSAFRSLSFDKVS